MLCLNHQIYVLFLCLYFPAMFLFMEIKYLTLYFFSNFLKHCSLVFVVVHVIHTYSENTLNSVSFCKKKTNLDLKFFFQFVNDLLVMFIVFCFCLFWSVNSLVSSFKYLNLSPFSNLFHVSYFPAIFLRIPLFYFIYDEAIVLPKTPKSISKIFNFEKNPLRTSLFCIVYQTNHHSHL